jgi:hypothetical protein
MAKKNEKIISVALRNGDDTKVKVNFRGGIFSPEEFTSMFMAILETYTVGLLKVNSKEAVFTHFNNVFGIFLNKIVPEKEHYVLSKPHEKYKEKVDSILGREETDEDKKYSEDVKFAAYLLAGDILQKELGMTADSANMILNRRLHLETPVLDKEDEKKS